MSAESSGLFTLKEINRIQILQDVIDRRITSGRAAEILGITPRHCSRLLNRYREHGPLSISNRSRGNPGNRLLPKAFTDQALEIIKEKYSDFGPTLARENLASSSSALRSQRSQVFPDKDLISTFEKCCIVTS